MNPIVTTTQRVIHDALIQANQRALGGELASALVGMLAVLRDRLEETDGLAGQRMMDDILTADLIRRRLLWRKIFHQDPPSPVLPQPLGCGAAAAILLHTMDCCLILNRLGPGNDCLALLLQAALEVLEAQCDAPPAGLLDCLRREEHCHKSCVPEPGSVRLQ